MKAYTPKKWDLSGLQGISDDTLQIHFGLYEGYVKNTNTLMERLTELRSGGKNSSAGFTRFQIVSIVSNSSLRWSMTPSARSP